MRSEVFKFVVGPDEKEFNVHEAALSGLSRPLEVLLEGPFKEARESRVDWPEVDESTFVRFVEWAYTGNYREAKPETVLKPNAETQGTSTPPATESALHSLNSLGLAIPSPPQSTIRDCCRNPECPNYKQNQQFDLSMVECIRCRRTYASRICSSSSISAPCCGSVFSDCSHPICTDSRRKFPGTCSNQSCGQYCESGVSRTSHKSVTCPFCRKRFRPRKCLGCASVLGECPSCPLDNFPHTVSSKRDALVQRFMAQFSNLCPPLADPYLPLANTGASEDYTEVFLCHAKLYILGDLYDLPALRQLSFHRLYATLRAFVLYPSRMTDIATLTSYLFENTRPDDKVRDMMTLYYACIIENASKHDGLKRLIDEIPDFAHGLIVNMSDRLS